MLGDDILFVLLFEVFKRRELLRCERGTEVEETEALTVFTLVSDSESSFLTASGEWVPYKMWILNNKFQYFYF